MDTRGQATQVTRTFPKALASAILGEGDVCVWGPMRRFSSHLSAHKHQGTASFSNKASKGQMVRDQGAATVSRKPVLTRGCLLCRDADLPCSRERIGPSPGVRWHSKQWADGLKTTQHLNQNFALWNTSLMISQSKDSRGDTSH